MKIFVGLGNPGEEYANTYHNVGWLALVKLVPDDSPRASYKKLFEYAEADGVVFVWPLTFMNESGKAVREALKKFKAKPEDLVVFQDDSDLTVGNYKISFARSSAGHKGTQSIIDALKTNAFERVRIGIRPTREAQRQKAGEFALKRITPSDKKALNSVFAQVAREMSAPRSRNLSSTRS
jgi:peptidyl-tRNA hydrolase, PTH1 family